MSATTVAALRHSNWRKVSSTDNLQVRQEAGTLETPSPPSVATTQFLLCGAASALCYMYRPLRQSMAWHNHTNTADA